MLKKYPYVLLVLAACLWGGNFVAGRGLVAHIPPFTLAFFRWLIAFLVLLPLYGRGVWEQRGLYVRHWKAVLLLTATGTAAFNTLVYIAVQYTSSINAALMNAATPIVILLLSLSFLNERLTMMRLTGVAISVLGLLWIITGGSWSSLARLAFNRGDLWMVLAVVIWGIYSVAVKKTAGTLPASGLFTVTVLGAVVMLLPFAAVEWFSGRLPHDVSFADFAGVLYIGILASIVAFTSWNYAVSIIGPSRSSGFLNLIPVFGAIFAVLFTDEVIRLYHWIGAALVIGGVYLTARKQRVTSVAAQAGTKAG